MKIATTLAVMFRKSPKAEIIMIYTYGANRRWMTLPIKREHSHSMTQNIPGKQVLVRMCDFGKTATSCHVDFLMLTFFNVDFFNVDFL